MNKNITLIAVLLLLGTYSILPCYSQQDSIQTEEQNIKANKTTLEKAQEAFDNKDFQTTIDYLSVYINSKPKKYEPYKLRGDAYYELRQYENAEHDYQSAIELKTSNDKLMTGTKYVSAIVLGADKNDQLQNVELGNLYGRLMYAQKAQNDPAYATAYENAVKYNSHIFLPQPKKENIALINCPQKYGKKLNPQGIDADIYGAIDDIEKENFSQAIFKIQNITSQYPNYYLGYYLYGVALAGLEKDEEAILAFEKSLKLNPKDFESLASLGQIYYSKAETTFSQSDAKKSVEYFEKAIELNPNCYIYYFYIGLNNLQMGNTDLAISDFNNALKLNINDYNSMYYKLIAQYKKGDYQSVVNGTTKLLYRHVSNYNSVLYLRALANSKLENYDKALEDLNSIQNNIEDIYNADIKVVTDRDKALESYIYYLKSEIEHQNGVGASSDREKALQNPVIAQLSRVEQALKPYKYTLNADKISKTDYEKFADFYNTSLPKMLQNGIVLNESDVENQYDYIRTTFDDLGISFDYSNHEYKLSTIADYPYKKYSSKLDNTDFSEISQQTPEEVQKSVITPNNQFKLQEQTPQIEMIADENKPSLALMLASNQLPISKKAVEKPAIKQEETKVLTPEFKPEIPDAEKTDTSSNIAAGEPFIYIDKETGLVDKNNNENVKDILNEEKSIDTPPVPTSEKINDGIKITATETVETPDIVIKYDEPKPAVTVKHADVNPEDFGVKPTQTIPQIDENDEVIELSQKDLINTILPELNGKAPETISDTTHDKVIASSFEGAKSEITNVKEKLTETPQVVLPEIEQPKQEVEKQEVNEVPVVVVPELRAPEIITPEVQVQNTEETPKEITPETPQTTLETPLETTPEITQETAQEIAPETTQQSTPQTVIADTPASEEKPTATTEQSENAAEEISKENIKAQKEELKIQQEIAKKEQKMAEQKAKEEAKAFEEELKAQELEEKAQQKALQEAKKLEQKAQKELQKAEKLKQKKELKAKELEEKAQQKALQEAKKLEQKTQKELQKAEKLKQKEEQKAKILAQKLEKENEKIQAKAQKEKLKQERAQAIAEKKAKDAAKKAELKEQAKIEKEAKIKENELKKAQEKIQKEKEKSEKAVKNVKEDKKINLKNIFIDSNKDENTTSTGKTVIKSLEHK